MQFYGMFHYYQMKDVAKKPDVSYMKEEANMIIFALLSAQNFEDPMLTS